MKPSSAIALACILAVAAPGVTAGAGAVKVLDDFESGRINWTGDYQGSIVAEYPSHGECAFKVLFQAGVEYPGISAGEIDLDWSGYDTLKIDVYNPQGIPVNVSIRIDDDKSAGGYSSRYNGEFLLVNGQSFLEVPFSGMRAGDRPIDGSRIKVFRIFMSSPPKDTILYFDNIRVTRGEEPPETRGVRMSLASDGSEVKSLEEKARDARNRLAALVALAHKRGIGTLEPNIAVVTADLALDVRAKLPWFAERRGELYAYATDSCNEAYGALADTLEGRRPAFPVPPVYNSAALEFVGANLVEKGRTPGVEPAPVLLFSMLYHSQGPLCEYFAPINYFVHTHSFAGASRYDVENTPLYKAYHSYEDTHRVWNGDEGWCGHIIRDSASMGGGKEPVVVCLESPHTRDAVSEYIRDNAPRWKDDPNILINVMGGELSYICYCKYTLDMFRNYLQRQYGGIDALNSAWRTEYTSFDNVDTMPNSRQASENRARWYDWQAFNCWRFVEHAKWAKGVLRSIDNGAPVAVGAVAYGLRADFGRSGADEENLIREVDDVVLNESGPSTITTDLLWSLSGGQKPMFDFEYHGDVAGILPHFLHGNTAMAMWWWPDEPDKEFPQFNESALPFSWNIPLSDVAEALKIGLDVRRIAPEIAAFRAQSARIAILYSRASMLQVPPEFLNGTRTPYTMTLEDAYTASLGLDAPVRFISTRQIEEGELSRCNLLIVPGAAYASESEARGIFDFAQAGGTVLVIPNSLMYDQYARPADYLERLSVKVSAAGELRYSVSDTKRDAFLQGMIRETSASGSPRAFMAMKDNDLLPDGAVLETVGVPQRIALSGEARAIAFTPEGAPTLAQIPFGKGTFYYLAVPLAPESLNVLLDAVAARSGVRRPVRFSLASGKRDWRIEGRSAQLGDIVLFYIVNHAQAPLVVRVSPPFDDRETVDLRDPWKKVDPSAIGIAAGRTGIYAVRGKGRSK